MRGPNIAHESDALPMGAALYLVILGIATIGAATAYVLSAAPWRYVFGLVTLGLLMVDARWLVFAYVRHLIGRLSDEHETHHPRERGKSARDRGRRPRARSKRRRAGRSGRA